MVKPGGTGRPRLAISARLAPLPPSKSRMLAWPSALPSPKVNTHLPDFAASAPAIFGAVLAGLFGNVLRAPAGLADFARAAEDGFDFAAAFLVFDAALAMAIGSSARGEKTKRIARLTPRFAGSTQAAEPAWRCQRCSHFKAPRPIKPMQIR